MAASKPALGLLELESLARGVVVADVLVKQAAVEIALAAAVTPGKYLLVFVGGEAEVAESFQAAVAAAGALLIDSLHLPHIDERVVEALLRKSVAKSEPDDALGLVELHTVAATLRAADVALKAAQVALTHFEVARGIGGKGWFMLSGAQHDVEAALYAAAAAVEAPLLVTTELIQRPHADLRGRVI